MDLEKAGYVRGRRSQSRRPVGTARLTDAGTRRGDSELDGFRWVFDFRIFAISIYGLPACIR